MFHMRWSWCLVLGLLAGCAQPEVPVPATKAEAVSPPVVTPPPPPPPAPVVKPYVMHLPGVSGTSIVDFSLREGLRKAGFDGPFQIYDWTCHDPGIPALHNRVRNEEQAAIVADLLTRQFRAHPEQPIYLTCHSGGSGPAIWALERLPADVKVFCFVMLAPALSPSYDLTRALSHVSQHAYCFNSPDDDLVLGTGTKMFGTIDGVRCDAAGRIGFQQPPTADAMQYAKLIHQPYQSAWMRYGHIGGHIGCMGTPFVQAIVGPMMLGRAAAAEVLNNASAQPLPDVLWPK
jgi:hypothetical protein